MSNSKSETLENPFALLNVSTRDDSVRIMEAAEAQSLSNDAEMCQRARAELTNPRRRLEAEFAWFPGVSPSTGGKAKRAKTIEEVDELSLTGLAKANALMRAVSHNTPITTERVSVLIESMVAAIDEIDLDQLLREVNEDRMIASFPPFTSTDIAEETLSNQRRKWRRGLINILDSMPTKNMTEAVFTTVKGVAPSQFSPFLHELIDDYALRAQPFLLDEISRAEQLVGKAREVAEDRPDALRPIFSALGSLLETWEELTYPIQMSSTLRGQTDAESERLAFLVRSLSVDMFNEHDLIDESRALSQMVGSRFSALPKVTGTIEEDGTALDGLERSAHEHRAELAYAADIGTFFKRRLAISIDGLEWNGRRSPLDEIRGVRWGGLRKSVNGIPAGTSYLIAWRDSRDVVTVEFSNEAIFNEFIERLWKAVAVQIFGRIITTLKNGHELQFGDVLVRDQSVILRKKKLFGTEPVEYLWADVTVRNDAGQFVIDGPLGSKATAAMSYRDVDNAHFFESLLRRAFAKGCTHMSEAFE